MTDLRMRARERAWEVTLEGIGVEAIRLNARAASGCGALQCTGCPDDVRPRHAPLGVARRRAKPCRTRVARRRGVSHGIHHGFAYSLHPGHPSVPLAKRGLDLRNVPVPAEIRDPRFLLTCSDAILLCCPIERGDFDSIGPPDPSASDFCYPSES